MDGETKKIRERLRRLLSMTVENGATEAEAISAAEKAAKLMADHNLHFRSVEEIEAEDYAPDQRDWFRGSKGRARSAPIPVTRWCIDGISRLCNVESCWNTYTGQLEFFGAPHETEAAHYFEEIIRRAIEREWTGYRQRHGGRGGSGFKHAMAMRIASRLNKMADEAAKSSQTGTGTDLVVVRRALVEKRFSDRHPRLRTCSANPTFSDHRATCAGFSAGDKVALNRAVNEASGVLAIE